METLLLPIQRMQQQQMQMHQSGPAVGPSQPRSGANGLGASGLNSGVATGMGSGQLGRGSGGFSSSDNVEGYLYASARGLSTTGGVKAFLHSDG